MSGFSAGSFPDSVREPRGEVRGNVVVLGGLGEQASDFDLLTDQLLLTGFRVTIFDDVSVDTESSQLGVLRVLEDRGLTGPLVLIGSDLGSALVAGLVARGEAHVAAAVLGNLVTPASRPSTVTVADFTAFEEAFPGQAPRQTRLPVGIRLPAPTTSWCRPWSSMATPMTSPASPTRSHGLRSCPSGRCVWCPRATTMC
ncbi:hypothetical protein AX769_16210 [Frondihabitans sp. PAMC 28766]|uniref:hypothetical protein n=1 Tax=Frondihabitans sp. PAMC 28766 TaxID=1795630 RepID=UPI00078D9ABF|nr:hypothetical protein [Frondihabitans sp. PAMC 28766]AMM21392.1 hypothetical protein AX769_16210 [Frondihabitans sp. PAMC 28766]